jgi:serine/threonine protein kinase
LNSNYASTNPSQSSFSNANIPSSPLLPGKQIRDFIVGKSLGEGKFGTVYQVTHKPTGALFALKKVPK